VTGSVGHGGRKVNTQEALTNTQRLSSRGYRGGRWTLRQLKPRYGRRGRTGAEGPVARRQQRQVGGETNTHNTSLALQGLAG